MWACVDKHENLFIILRANALRMFLVEAIFADAINRIVLLVNHVSKFLKGMT